MLQKQSTTIAGLFLIGALAGCSGGSSIQVSGEDKYNLETSTVSNNKLPLDLKTTVHNEDALENLTKIPVTIHANPVKGELILSPALEVVSYSETGPSQPMDFKDGNRYSLGGDKGEGFVGYWPWYSIITTDSNGNSAELKLSDNSEISGHELILDKDGNYWFTRHLLESCSEYLDYCGGANKPETVSNIALCTINQASPSGEILYTWRAVDHLPLSEIRSEKWSKLGGSYPPIKPGENPEVAAPWHCNATDISDDGEFFLVSMRHTDSVYKIDKSSGEVVWKLGGNNWPGKSLILESTPEVDSSDPMSGQHDSRFMGTDLISVFDNGTGTERGARGLVFEIDEGSKKASVQTVMEDPFGNPSNCTGSFRSFANNSYWVAGWGCSPNAATVFDKTGTPIVSIAPAETERNKDVFAEIGVTPQREKFLNRQISYRFTPKDS